MEKGDNVKNIFTRFSNATAAIGEVIKISLFDLYCGPYGKICNDPWRLKMFLMTFEKITHVDIDSYTASGAWN